MNNIGDLVVALSNDPFNEEINFACAVEYERLNQTASAVSFYLRTAEYGESLLVYNSLLKVAQCMDNQTDRINTVSNCILQAITFAPYRPEAYFLMSQFHERQSNWQESYTWAEMGLSYVDPWKEFNHLPASVGYEDYFCLEFQKGIAAWWIGRKEESKEILNRIYVMDIPQNYKDAIKYNIERIGL
jgi:hypothetical protein